MLFSPPTAGLVNGWPIASVSRFSSVSVNLLSGIEISPVYRFSLSLPLLAPIVHFFSQENVIWQDFPPEHEKAAAEEEEAVLATAAE